MGQWVNGWYVQSYAYTQRGIVPVEELTPEERARLARNIYRALAKLILPPGYDIRFPDEDDAEEDRGAPGARAEGSPLHPGLDGNPGTGRRIHSGPAGTP